MQLQNTFTVPADVETAWKTLLDVQRVAPCMPGATLGSGDANRFEGTVKVKLGPVSMTYGGEAAFVERDDRAHRAVIEATGKETRGSGTAAATVTTELFEEGVELTRVVVTTELSVTGKPAQFGRGVMQDVAARVIGQFADNLAAMIGADSTPAGQVEQGPVQTTRPAEPLVPDSIDLLSASATPVLKRLVPVVAGVAIAALVVMVIVRSRRRSAS